MERREEQERIELRVTPDTLLYQDGTEVPLYRLTIVHKEPKYPWGQDLIQSRLKLPTIFCVIQHYFGCSDTCRTAPYSNHPVECHVTRFRSSESEPEAIDEILKLNRCVCSKLFFHVKFYGGVVESSTVCGP